ncbi:MAG: hypothetical protein IMZ62_13060 [Chloroflexi bacterium]|nr:hypothetical protein [Chloroflexota bacterium]MBE3119808.1 hypothetical protein [Candidatus Atribacteria bacterium]
MDTKHCPRCGEDKHPTEFTKDRQTYDGLACYCKVCRKAQAAARYAANPEKRRVCNAKSYQKNRDKVLERTRRYVQQHPEAQRARLRLWYMSNRAHARATHKAYAATPEGKAASRRGYAKWAKSAQGKAWLRAYRVLIGQQAAARDALHGEIRSGKVIRPTACSLCGHAGPVAGHHHKGYAPEHWLDVEWLCRQCHDRRHAI